jgi:hypothetical protein
MENIIKFYTKRKKIYITIRRNIYNESHSIRFFSFFSFTEYNIFSVLTIFSNSVFSVVFELCTRTDVKLGERTPTNISQSWWFFGSGNGLSSGDLRKFKFFQNNFSSISISLGRRKKLKKNVETHHQCCSYFRNYVVVYQKLFFLFVVLFWIFPFAHKRDQMRGKSGEHEKRVSIHTTSSQTM